MTRDGGLWMIGGDAGGALGPRDGATGVVLAVAVARCDAGCLPTGLGRAFRAGVAASRSSAGTEIRGAWIGTGDASDVAVCGLELDFVAMRYATAFFSMWMSDSSS
jgi:hypothetical protein